MEKEGKSDGDGDGGDRSTIIKVNVKFAGRSIPVEISDESTVKHLKSLLQPLTNVLPRGQKLIFKGTQYGSFLFVCLILTGIIHKQDLLTLNYNYIL